MSQIIVFTAPTEMVACGPERTWHTYEASLKTYKSRKKEAMRYVVTAVTSIPQLKLEYCSIILEVCNQL